MSEKPEEKPDVIKFVKKKTLLKKHSEPYGTERYYYFFTTPALQPSYNCDVSIHFFQYAGHFQHALIETDTVCNRNCNFNFPVFFIHKLSVVSDKF